MRQLPNMTHATYRELAYGSGRTGGVALTSIDDALPDCERCHAEDGRGSPDVPVLAGQREAYLLSALDAYASGKRASGVMGAAAGRVDRDTIIALARHYANLPSRLAEYTSGASGEALAQHIVENGLPETNLPACVNCHAPGKRPDYPLLGGQKFEYMAARLRRWRGEANVVDARKPNESMPVIARRIPEDMIDPLARYYARQGHAP